MTTTERATVPAPPLSCAEIDQRGLHRWVKAAALYSLGQLSRGLRAVGGSCAGEALGILTYHRVCPRFPGVPRPPWDVVTPARFREQLSGLQARGFSFWPLSRVLQCRGSDEPIPPRTLVATFDDGFQSVYRWAWPVLRELSVPATVFLVTGSLDDTEPFYFDLWGRSCREALPPEAYAPLTTEQCREMTRGRLIGLGTHTHTHADFRGRPEALFDDLRASMAVLHERFDLRGDAALAFPFGKPHLGFADAPCLAAAAAAGVSCVLTAGTALVDPHSDPLGWGRFHAFPWDTSGTLAGKLSGWYGWAPAARARWLKFIRRRGGSTVTGWHGDRVTG
jgi:peptidoglycan/xylan/chitin deacetylase (PgdA/CDA1 family)